MTGGLDCCVVGSLPQKYLEIHGTLNGQWCQVLEIWIASIDPTKQWYLLKHEGVAQCILVDYGSHADNAINLYFSDLESNSANDESNSGRLKNFEKLLTNDLDLYSI